MEFHLGRLIDHVHLRVSDLEASRRFYQAVLKAVGREFSSESPKHFACDELWVDRADGPVSRVHLAFQARDREAVQAFHAAALAFEFRDTVGTERVGFIALRIETLFGAVEHIISRDGDEKRADLATPERQ